MYKNVYIIAIYLVLEITQVVFSQKEELQNFIKIYNQTISDKEKGDKFTLSWQELVKRIITRTSALLTVILRLNI